MSPGWEQPFLILDAPALPADPVAARPLFGLSNQQLEEAMAEFSAPTWRARQLGEALYRQRVETLDEITPWPKTLRERVRAAGFEVGLPRIAQAFQSVDGTERYLLAVAGGQTVETVWMPEGDDGEAGDGSEAGDEEQGSERRAQGSAGKDQPAGRKRATICVSSQIGCAVNCRFCLTAKLGIQRNLTAGEIAGQVAAVLKRHDAEPGRDRINLVFMGMGEPFLNYDAFMAAARLLVEEVGIAESRMTVSTSGVVPGILRFAAEPVRPKLAISLNASNDQVRESVMPITRKWDIAAVLDAVRQLPLRPRERVTFEYVLLGGINDRIAHADEVVKLLRRINLPLKVNLIVWNPGPGIPYHMPEAADVSAFQQRLIDRGIPAFIRRPRGRDIYAACGQLKQTASATA
ncbi:23S rRNA (adenine(2503)-C(2))-methyltransferase RlmN [Paracidobacterium acidisoli]|uniref:Probable dual-specificity RNA methyltransferase RlmN n=1 Tax=Paracidobacterium acidisoli TaxID=2303751 RepID=A0A372IKS5_9BACT|nr:23S rRNA (adenine(2503)-C(2))-methyltransferase RlmN [Paracidobacterium acidisoli]MBT9332752.1 23S rRNA (adenine(2503)-C(2))-methyltransferase RlmN [Paracidobacterium acidisoli]